MGCSSSATANPEPPNFCGDDDELGMLVDVPGSCFFTTDPGKFCSSSSHDQWCFGQVNGSTEWTGVGNGAGCGVCSSCRGLGQGPGDGLCGYGSGSCSWAGARYRCRRDAFNGNPLACCRRSKSIHGLDLHCFDDASRARTCDPQYRGFGKPSCVPIMATYCSNDTEENMKSKWTGTAQNKDCLRYVSENAGNLDFYGDVIGAMVNRYLITENRPITSPQSDGGNHDPFIDTILQICRENAGACDDVLTQKCAGVTREELGQNVNLAGLCGCFLDDSEYTKFSSFGVERVCDPLCVIGSSVKPLDTTTFNPAKFQTCKDTICIIDDVTVQVLAGSVTGDISFSQVCGSCAGEGSSTGSCRCYITDTSLQAVNSLVKDVTFNQQCGGAPQCWESSGVPGTPLTQVDCGTGEPNDGGGGSGGGGNQQVGTLLWVVLAFLAILLLFLIFFALLQRNRSGETAALVAQQAAYESEARQPPRSLGGYAYDTTGARPIIGLGSTRSKSVV